MKPTRAGILHADSRTMAFPILRDLRFLSRGRWHPTEQVALEAAFCGIVILGKHVAAAAEYGFSLLVLIHTIGRTMKAVNEALVPCGMWHKLRAKPITRRVWQKLQNAPKNAFLQRCSCMIHVLMSIACERRLA